MKSRTAARAGRKAAAIGVLLLLAGGTAAAPTTDTRHPTVAGAEAAPSPQGTAAVPGVPGVRGVPGAPAAPVGRASSTLAVIDDSGRTITLERPAHRIVSLSPHLTELLYAVGAGARIVGASDYSDWPPAALSIPRVARAHAVDLERIAALHPDLIVIWGSGYAPATLEAVRRLGVPVYVDEPTQLDGIAASLLRLGQLTAGDGAAPARALRETIASLREHYAGRTPVRVFYQVWAQPLMTLGRPHVLTEALRVCGGRNVFEDLEAIAPQVSIEAVLVADPDALVTAEPDAHDVGALDSWSHFPSLKAVRGNQRITLDANRLNRHSPRMADELGVLCERLDRVRTNAAR